MKKINYNDAAYICRYKNKHPFKKYFCNWYIWMNNPNEGIIKCNMKLWFYILILIPFAIINFFYLLWDGGIKNFEFEPRNIYFDNIIGSTSDNDDSTMFGRFKQIYNKKA